MPTKKEAWVALGHVYWKKSDLLASQKCFEGSLQQDPNDKEVLRNLSMVVRQITETEVKKRKENYAHSIELASKAVGLDLKDSQSWCKYFHLEASAIFRWINASLFFLEFLKETN